MEDIITSTETVAPKTESPKTLDQHAADLDAWLKERGLQPIVVARGIRTGALVPVDDFMPDTHVATFVLQPVQK